MITGFEDLPRSWGDNDFNDAIIVLWQNSHLYTETGAAGSCSHFNTLEECERFEPVPFSREIHFADYPPTDWFDTTQFGRFDDTSDPASGRYFKNKNNLGWALKINTNWCHPREYSDVVWAYPAYEQWVENTGENANNWFKASTRTRHY